MIIKMPNTLGRIDELSENINKEIENIKNRTNQKLRK